MIQEKLKETLEKLKEFPKQKYIVIMILVALIVFIWVNQMMASIESYLKGATGYGVLDFEFAWTADGIQKIFSAWGSTGKQLEATAIYWDFLYIPAYAFLIAGCNLLVVQRLEGKPQEIGLYIVITPFIAGLLDVIENINLLLMINDDIFINLGSPFIASICATVKFGLVFLGIIFFVLALIILMISTIRKSD